MLHVYLHIHIYVYLYLLPLIHRCNILYIINRKRERERESLSKMPQYYTIIAMFMIYMLSKYRLSHNKVFQTYIRACNSFTLT